MKKSLKHLFLAIVIGGVVTFVGCTKEKGIENLTNENPSSLNPGSYMTEIQAVSGFLALGYVETSLPANYVQESNAVSVRYFIHSNGDDIYLHKYSDPIDVQNDDWSVACTEKWESDGEMAGSCHLTSNECRVEVKKNPDAPGGYSRKIICCD
jgi:hypothetical protein